jgi:hypothetical protein
MAYGGSHAQEEWTEGKVTLHAGDVVRMNDFGAFSDSVILGFNGDKDYPTARVSRPYVYASGVGTTGPVPLLGTETYELPVEHIIKHFKIMENDGHRRT